MELLTKFSLIGIKTAKDILRFKAECMAEGETLKEALDNYINELGENFRVEE